MKRLLLIAFFFFSFGAYALDARSLKTSDTSPTLATIGQTTNTTPVTTETPAPPSTTTLTPTPTTKPKPPATPTPTPVVPIATKPKGQYTDGTYVGNQADAYYGFIKVKAVVSGGKLTDVVFLEYPNDRRTSIQINQQAMPYLRSEALTAQSADVSGVSGASYTSAAFIESLGSALAQAKA